MYQMENKNYIQGIGHKIVFQIIIDRFKMKKKPIDYLKFFDKSLIEMFF